MPRERISMRKIKEVLRLVFDCKTSKCQAAKVAGISHSTASDYIARFKTVGLVWPLPQDAGDAFLEEKLYHTNTYISAGSCYANRIHDFLSCKMRNESFP